MADTDKKKQEREARARAARRRAAAKEAGTTVTEMPSRKSMPLQMAAARDLPAPADPMLALRGAASIGVPVVDPQQVKRDPRMARLPSLLTARRAAIAKGPIPVPMDEAGLDRDPYRYADAVGRGIDDLLGQGTEPPDLRERIAAGYTPPSEAAGSNGIGEVGALLKRMGNVGYDPNTISRSQMHDRVYRAGLRGDIELPPDRPASAAPVRASEDDVRRAQIASFMDRYPDMAGATDPWIAASQQPIGGPMDALRSADTVSRDPADVHEMRNLRRAHAARQGGPDVPVRWQPRGVFGGQNVPDPDYLGGQPQLDPETIQMLLSYLRQR